MNLDAALTKEETNMFENLGDWELDTTNPMAPAFISPSERRFQRFLDTTIGTFAYILTIYFGSKPVKRTDFIQSYAEYRAEMDSIPSNWKEISDYMKRIP